MTPLHLEILLWYYSSAVDYPFEGNATRLEYAGHLLADEVLYKSEGAMQYGITMKGRAWIEHVLTLPWPKQQWVMPT